MENMSDIKNKDVQDTDANEAPNEAKVPNQKRRALAKAALAAPVLGALASKPALGAARTCSVSVLMSGNTSVDTDWESCGGCSPGFWFNPAKDCFLVDAGVTNSTTFGDPIVFNTVIIDPPTSLYDHILNVLTGWTLPVFNDDSKTLFVNAVASAYGSLLTPEQKNIVKAIFQFARGVFCAWLNARTIGARFPFLIATGALHSIAQLQAMVDALYADPAGYSAGSMITDMNDVYADWDYSEEVTCSMFGSCPKDGGSGVYEW